MGCDMGPSRSEFWVAQEMGFYLELPETTHNIWNVKKWCMLLIDHIQQGHQNGKSEGKMQAISLGLSQNVVVKTIDNQFCSWNVCQIRLWPFCPHDPLGEEGEAGWGWYWPLDLVYNLAILGMGHGDTGWYRCKISVPKENNLRTMVTCSQTVTPFLVEFSMNDFT